MYKEREREACHYFLYTVKKSGQRQFVSLPLTKAVSFFFFCKAPEKEPTITFHLPAVSLRKPKYRAEAFRRQTKTLLHTGFLTSFHFISHQLCYGVKKSPKQSCAADAINRCLKKLEQELKWRVMKSLPLRGLLDLTTSCQLGQKQTQTHYYFRHPSLVRQLKTSTKSLRHIMCLRWRNLSQSEADTFIHSFLNIIFSVCVFWSL